MNPLAISAASAANFAAMFLIAKFLLMQLAIKLRGTPAGQGLAALVL